MAKYISSIDLAHYSNLTHDEIIDLLCENDLSNDESIPKITQKDYALIREEFDESSQSKIDQYFGSQSDVKYQFDLLGGIKEVKPKKTKEKVIPKRTWEEPDYLPNLEESLNYQYKFFKDISQPQDEELIFDIEVYGNYFLIMFLGYRTGRCWYFEKTENQALDVVGVNYFIKNHSLISFNGIKFDLPLLSIALAEADFDTLWHATELLINDENGLRPYQIVKQFKGVKLENIDHIDLIEVAPLKGSLKLYGARLHTPNLQDLPFKPGINLTSDQIAIVRRYCLNDVETTAYLYNKLIPNVELRKSVSKQYGLELRSKSDAQMAEAIIKSECESAFKKKLINTVGETPPYVRFNKPDYIKFDREDLQKLTFDICNTKFHVNDSGVQGGILDSLTVNVAGAVIRLGIGGIHSSEENVSHYSDDEFEIIDIDIAAMYPRYIIKESLTPPQLKPHFLPIYTSIYERRLKAKETKDKLTDAILKVCINGSYGKLGSKYSILFAPELMINVTIGGQLSILMLAEKLEQNNWLITSANTDGLTIKLPRKDRDSLIQVVSDWEHISGYKMEYAYYKSTHNRDVNNYYACKTDGSIKRKGAYGEETLSKNPQNMVCTDAVAQFLLGKDTIENHVYSCNNIRKFLTVRNVTGGAIKDTEYLGKTVRFYHSTSTSTGIHYAKSGNSVPTSDRCRPLMKLPKEFPIDVDRQWYIDECYRILKDIGVKYDSQ